MLLSPTKRPQSLAAALVAIVLLMTGCWDRREVETLAFVTSTGIDLDDSANPDQDPMIELTLEIANAGLGGGAGPSAAAPGEGGTQPTTVRTGRGPTPLDALLDVQANSGRTIFIAHNRVIVLAADIPRRRELARVLDYFDRSGEARGTSFLAVADGVPAREVIHAIAPFTGRSGSILADAIRVSHAERGTPMVTLRQFLILSSLEGIDPVLPRIVRDPLAPDGPEPPDAHSEGGFPPRLSVRLEGAALFRGDHMVGALDEIETKGLMWATSQLHDAYVDVPCPTDERSLFVLSIQRSHGRLSLELEPALRGRIHVVMEGRLIDVQCPREDFDVTSAGIAAAQAHLKDRIEQSIRRAVQKSQALGADPFGFGAELHRRAPKLWREVEERWYDTLWPALPVDIAVEVDIRRSGLVMESYTAR